MKESLEDYTRVLRGRYARRTGRQARGRLLDEYCASTGLERKYATKVLGGQRGRGGGGGGGARRARAIYGAEDIAVLRGVWLAAGQPCGKRLAGAMLQLWLASWARHHGELGAGQRERLEKISAAQLDRKMAPYRSAGRQRRIASSALAAMQREVAVRCEPWAETAPGALEIDTVALCGGSMSGAIIWALDATDIHSGWTEVRAVWNRGGAATRERMSEIEAALPFVLRKLDFDNGTEFLHAHFLAHYRGREGKVELSRSRPYRKNDNAHIEQKNYTHVRLLLGDDRFEHPELVEPLNEVLRQWSLWNNLYGAQRRLVRKERQADGKVKRHHEKQAATPCARLLAREDLSAAARVRLEALLAAHDPIDLKERLETKLRALYELRARLQEQDQAEGEPAGTPPEPPDPGAHASGWAGWRSGRSVACGSVAPCAPARPPAGGPPQRSACPPPRTRPKKTPATVSITVRHRAAS